MYSNIKLRVKTDNFSLSDAFLSEVGVFQGDNLSPNVFSIFIDDIVKSFDTLCDPILLRSRPISCMLYADDLLLMSESPEGLQNCMKKAHAYCSDWGMKINYSKTKVMVFNKGSRLAPNKFYINSIEIESTRQYKYLSTSLQIN